MNVEHNAPVNNITRSHVDIHNCTSPDAHDASGSYDVKAYELTVKISHADAIIRDRKAFAKKTGPKPDYVSPLPPDELSSYICATPQDVLDIIKRVICDERLHELNMVLTNVSKDSLP